MTFEQNLEGLEGADDRGVWRKGIQANDRAGAPALHQLLQEA